MRRDQQERLKGTAMGDSTSNVLIVDDSAAVRSAVELMLRGQPYVCHEAADGSEALEVLDAHDVDCVISDLHMPVMSGFEFLRRMRELPNYRYTPVLILTTDRVDENRTALRSAGATGVLSKPIEPDVLLKAVEKALAGRKDG